MESVSVIMPAYNAARYIAEAIASVQAQIHTDWELIVIDDGSTDDTATIVKQTQLNDDRVKYFYQQNAKQGASRTMGVKASGTNLIAFLDSDDIWLPNRLSMMLTEFKKGEQDILFADAFVFIDKFNAAKTIRRFGVTDAVYEGEDGLKAFLEYNRIPMLTTLIDKEAIVKAGYFSDRAICEDYELWLKMLLNGCRFRSISKSVAAYRIHDGATTADDKLAVEVVIDVIGKLHEGLPPAQSRLFKGFLAQWHRRKLETISDSVSLDKFFKKLREQEIWGIKLSIASLFNLRSLFVINKKITGKILSQWSP